MPEKWEDTVIEVSADLASRVSYPIEGMIDREKVEQAKVSFKAGYEQALKDNRIDTTTSSVV